MPATSVIQRDHLNRWGLGRPASLRVGVSSGADSDPQPERAALNHAFAPAEPEIRSSYDTAELDPAVIADASRTDPLPPSAGRRVTEQEHAGPLRAPSPPPLTAPANDAMYHTYRSDLSQVRALVLEQAREAGLAEGRANDLVLAVSEVAANTLRHTRSSGTLAIWHDEDEVVCEIRDEGTITRSARRPAQARARRQRRSWPLDRPPGL